MFPVIAVRERIEQNVAEVMLNAVGAETFVHGYNPIKDIAVCRNARRSVGSDFSVLTR